MALLNNNSVRVTDAVLADNAAQESGGNLAAIVTETTAIATSAASIATNTGHIPSDPAREGGNLATIANAQGTGANGVSQLTGGSGIVGWLSGIFSKCVTIAQLLAGTLTISGTVTSNVQGGNSSAVKVDGSATTQPISGSVSVSNFPGTQAVSGTFWPTTQPVSGSVSVSNLPATQTVAGTVSVSNFPATQAVSATALPLAPNASVEAGGHLESIDTCVQSIPGDPAREGGNLLVLTSAVGTTTLSPTQGTGILGWISDLSTKLASIYTKLTGSIAVTGTFWQTTQPTSPSIGTPVTGTLQNANDTIATALGVYPGARFETTGGAFTSSTFVPEYSSDNGATWNPAAMISLASGSAGEVSSIALAGNAAYLISQPGATNVRVRLSVAGGSVISARITPIWGVPTAHQSVNINNQAASTGSNADAASQTGNAVRVAGSDSGSLVRTIRTDKVGAIVQGNNDKATFSMFLSGCAPTSANSYLMAIESGTTKVTRIKRVIIHQIGNLTSAQQTIISLIRETTASSGGGTNTPGVRETTDTFTGTVRTSTSGITPGSLGTTVKQISVYTPASAGPFAPLVFDLTNGNTHKGIVVPTGTANGVLFRVDSGAAGYANLAFEIEFTEE